MTNKQTKLLTMLVILIIITGCVHHYAQAYMCVSGKLIWEAQTCESDTQSLEAQTCEPGTLGWGLTYYIPDPCVTQYHFYYYA